jgi:hypothetical protein
MLIAVCWCRREGLYIVGVLIENCGGAVVRKIMLVVLITLFFTKSSVVCAVGISKNSISGVAQAYGFLVGQDSYLKYIVERFPELKKDAKIASLKFEATFPGIRDKLERELNRMGGMETVQSLSPGLMKDLRNEVYGKGFLKRNARLFIDEVLQRADGNIYSPVLEYLLTVQYADNPFGEFRDGFSKAYKTNGHEKSRNIKMLVRIPKSWKGSEGSRPHIVQKWIDENGGGRNMITLLIMDAEGFNPTKEDIKYLISSGKLKEGIPKDAVYNSAGAFTIEGVPGFWIKQDLVMERAGVEYQQKIIQYSFVYGGSSIQLMCHSGGVLGASDIQENFEKIEPLCLAILNSVVLEDKYK